MSEETSPPPGGVDDFEDPPRQPGRPDDVLHVDVGGFEGPLDLLLSLARRNQIDLTRIQILPLAEQYLAFIAEAKALRIELAADFLVMASWLAYLKSRLIAPEEEEDAGADGKELAEDLAFRLRRLEAMREAADRLFARPRLGRDVFARGMPEATRVQTTRTFRASLYDLLTAYGAIRQEEIVQGMTMEKRPVFSPVDARRVMERLVGRHADWVPLEVISRAMPANEDRRAALAATFGAALEMAREGRVAMRQSGPFAPLYVRPTPEGEERGDG
jgi:segregation and condensation protein A